MRHTPDSDFLREWLEETEGSPADHVEGTKKAVSHLDETEQASRWLPFPVFYRGAQTTARPPAATDTTEYQPNLIPATNGHSPTVIGRTQSMLSPAKAIAAGAVIFAIGGVMLIAQPFDQPSSAPGAATDEVPQNLEAAEVTGRALMRGERREVGGDFVMIDMGGTINTGAVAGVWSTSDPRLNGTVTRTVTWHWDGASDIAIDAHTYELTNDGGRWLGEGNGYLTDLRGDPLSVRWVALTGRDGYEGLSAMVVLETGNVLQPAALNLKGVIFPSEVPEVPEPYVAE